MEEKKRNKYTIAASDIDLLDSGNLLRSIHDLKESPVDYECDYSKKVLINREYTDLKKIAKNIIEIVKAIFPNKKLTEITLGNCDGTGKKYLESAGLNNQDIFYMDLSARTYPDLTEELLKYGPENFNIDDPHPSCRIFFTNKIF